VDFVCIQETMRKSYTEKFFRTLDSQKNFNWFWTPSKGKSGGMLSGIKIERFDLENFESGDFTIIANIHDKMLNKHLSLVNVYGPAQDELKDQFLCELANMCLKCKYPMLIGGDFNILRFSEDKNKNFVQNEFSDTFNRIINLYGLTDHSVILKPNLIFIVLFS
jgi:exonuclease III